MLGRRAFGVIVIELQAIANDTRSFLCAGAPYLRKIRHFVVGTDCSPRAFQELDSWRELIRLVLWRPIAH